MVRAGVEEICICHGYTFDCRITLLEHQVNYFAERSRSAEYEGDRWRAALVRRIDLGEKDVDAYVTWEDDQYSILLEERRQLNQEKRDHIAETKLLNERYRTYADMVREREAQQHAVEVRQKARAIFLQKIALELEIRQDPLLEE